MRATLGNHIIAESTDTVDVDGYHYFPTLAVRTEWLEKVPRTDKDKACPHGVQFYDVVIGGVRHPRAAWQYEWPRPNMAATARRFGFWEDVAVG